MRIAVVGADAAARDSVKRALVAGGHLDIATTSTPRQLIGPMAVRIAPDGCSVDLIVFCMHRRDQETISAVTVLCRQAHVLVIGDPDDTDTVLHVMRAGAGGYVNADAGAHLVAAAAYAVAAGLLFVYNGALRAAEQVAIANEGVDSRFPAALRADLSLREEQVLQLIADGFTHSQVAARIGVTKATVNTYVERIRSKLKVGNKAELTRAALLRAQAGPFTHRKAGR